VTAKSYTTSETAQQLGVSRQTLYTWIERGQIDAPKPLKIGRSTVRLWTKNDIQKARKFVGTLKPGPKGKKRKK